MAFNPDAAPQKQEEEIEDAIELTPKELEYDDAREAIEKKYADKKAELETAKLNLKKLSGYSYSMLKDELIDYPKGEDTLRGGTKLKRNVNYGRVGLTEDSGKEIIEIVENIERETKENEEYRRKALKDAMLKLTRSEKGEK